MRPFRLHRPESLDEAIHILEREGEDARPLSGGTELLLLMKQGFASYGHLVGLSRIPGMDGLEVRKADGALVIGAGVTHRQLERSLLVRERFPLLAEVEGKVANVRVRNSGTLAGNLAFAEPHSDPATLNIAWGAVLCIRGPKGARKVLAEEFWRGAFETVLQPAEVIESVELPSLPTNRLGAYSKFGMHERPSLGIAVFLTCGEGGRIEDPRVAVGCVEPHARRLGEVETVLQGKCAADVEASLCDIGAIAAGCVDPITDLHGSREYKLHLVAEFTARTLKRALDRNGEGLP